MTDPDHHHTPEEERRIREAALDETLADTFPASDPPSSIPNPDDDDLIEGDTAPSIGDSCSAKATRQIGAESSQHDNSGSRAAALTGSAFERRV